MENYKHKNNSGFTLLELIVTVAIIGLVMGFAIPGMSVMAQNDRLTTQINTLVGHLALARSEAVARGQEVVLCASDDSLNCSGSADWKTGWIVFIDNNSNVSVDANDEIIRVMQRLENSNTLNISSATANAVVYDTRGFLLADDLNNTPSFNLCDVRGQEYGKGLILSFTGRVRQMEEAAITC